MENQLTQLTAWVRAAQTQGGSEVESDAPFGPSGQSPPECHTSSLASGSLKTPTDHNTVGRME